MEQFGIKNPNADLGTLGLDKVKALWNLKPAVLIQKTIQLGQGQLSRRGALAVDTGEFTGRSPKDRFIVKDDITADTVNWGDINIPFEAEKFDMLYDGVINYLNQKEVVYARDASAGAYLKYRLKVRVVTEHPWQNLFAYNMFLRPGEDELETFEPDWQVIAASGYMADPAIHGTRQHNFAIINFTKKIIIIGGTAYTGEIKKGIFSVLNYILPTNHNVLSMHCSANVGQQGDTALFFGLSGTGKTTLSTDPNRKLIGDDEHGWSNNNVFNFEGGCYAKCINLSENKEPEIYRSIKFGAMLENILFKEDGCSVDYDDTSKTQNTRVSYPIYHIKNRMFGSRGEIPKNVFFLTCDAFGVLPPISRLTPEQAMYHFISGYTAKVAGTEAGIDEPVATFSACFGLPFLPLHPTKYADMLGKKIEEGTPMGDGKINVWLVNTGWTGGAYGVGSRMELAYTRSMIKAALDGRLNSVMYRTDEIFGFEVPETCPDVPNDILNPRNTWDDKAAFDDKANDLAMQFIANFKAFENKATPAILSAAPKMRSLV
ncbi:MAG: phosphoenolpyruvate carboxykinase (ATP) [Chitinophagales bacterium]